ncbi:hypothetical protein ES702_03603 [subsurface metagenome]
MADLSRSGIQQLCFGLAVGACAQLYSLDLGLNLTKTVDQCTQCLGRKCKTYTHPAPLFKSLRSDRYADTQVFLTVSVGET